MTNPSVKGMNKLCNHRASSVLWFILARCDVNGSVEASQPEIVDATGLSLAQVRQGIRVLVTNEVVEKESFKHGRMTTKITLKKDSEILLSFTGKLVRATERATESTVDSVRARGTTALERMTDMLAFNTNSPKTEVDLKEYITVGNIKENIVLDINKKEKQEKEKSESDESAFIRTSPNSGSFSAKDVLIYANQVWGRNYRPTEGNMKFINGRMREGYSYDECKLVIDNIFQQWSNPKMRRYLRFKTVFSPENFPGYLENAKDNLVVPLLCTEQPMLAFDYMISKYSDLSKCVIDCDDKYLAQTIVSLGGYTAIMSLRNQGQSKLRAVFVEHYQRAVTEDKAETPLINKYLLEKKVVYNSKWSVPYAIK